MSGAAGLSAARRRRAGSAQTVGLTPTNTSIRQRTSAQTTSSAISSGAPHPMQILQDHEMRLREIEPKLEELATGGNTGAPHIPIPVQTKMPDLSTIFDRLASIEAKVGDADTETIRSTLMKVQTFAIETNTAVLRLQQEIENIKSTIQTQVNEDSSVENAVEDKHDNNQIQTANVTLEIVNEDDQEEEEEEDA